jgi:hypothetical protein
MWIPGVTGLWQHSLEPFFENPTLIFYGIVDLREYFQLSKRQLSHYAISWETAFSKTCDFDQKPIFERMFLTKRKGVQSWNFQDRHITKCAIYNQVFRPLPYSNRQLWITKVAENVVFLLYFEIHKNRTTRCIQTKILLWVKFTKIYVCRKFQLNRTSRSWDMGTLRPPFGQMVTFRTFCKMLMKSQGLNIFWNGLCQNS